MPTLLKNLSDLTPLMMWISAILVGSLLFVLGAYTNEAIANHNKDIDAHASINLGIQTQLTKLSVESEERQKDISQNLELILKKFEI